MGWGRGSGRLRLAGRAAIGAVGIVFGSIAYCWATLPDVRPLRTQTPATTAFMRMRAAEAASAGKPPAVSQRFVRYGRISPLLVRAVLVAEEAAFFSLDGVSPTNTAQGLIASEFAEAINARYGTEFAGPDVAGIAAADPLVCR